MVVITKEQCNYYCGDPELLSHLDLLIAFLPLVTQFLSPALVNNNNKWKN